jgi:hypothetical protein
MLRQSGGRTLSLTIRRESSVDNLYQPLGVTSDHRHRTPDQTLAVATPTRQWDFVLAKQCLIARAVSWFGSAILEGFALYGQALYPCVLDLSEDCHAQAEKARRPASTPLPPLENPWSLPPRSSCDIDIRPRIAAEPSDSPHSAQRWFRPVA